jgi:hypothetical protein
MDTMTKVRHRIHAQQLQEIIELKEENILLRELAFTICDKWVHPDMYANARKEIENIYEKMH